MRVVLAATALVALATVQTAAPADAAAALDRPVQSFTVVAEGGPHPFTWSWSPDALTFRLRGKVTWENPTTVEHRVDFWDGPGAEKLQLDPGGSATLTLRKPGVYSYRCDIAGHSDIIYAATERICVGMCGEITVE